MSHCRLALLEDRAVLRVTGSDARIFLQGLVTNNVDGLEAGGAIHTGLLTPQGKILFDFFIVAVPDGFLLDVARAQAADLAKRLGFYRLRADVAIAAAADLQVAAAWDGPPSPPEGSIVYADPRLAAMGWRVILPVGGEPVGLGCEAMSEADYHTHRISLGVPEGGRDYAYGDTFPHEALFDQLKGVAFDKGCYVGQEVVSRMEHRGTARKRIVPVESDGHLPPMGTPVEADGVPIGALGSVSGSSGLALIRLDRASEALARGGHLRAGAATLVLRQPSFARFSVPTAPAAA